jgi:adenylate cyclase
MDASVASAEAGYRLSIEPSPRRVRVVWNGVTVAETERALRLRETRHEPVYYLPREDVRMDLMRPSSYRTHCPFKGDASYWSLEVDGRVAENVLWGYEDPLPEAEALRGHVAFYRSRVDGLFTECDEVEIDPCADFHAHANPLADWLLRDAWEAASIEELVARLARQLDAVGVPVTRLNLMVRTLHPQVLGTLYIWRRERDRVERIELTHGMSREERFLTSPLVSIFRGDGGVRRRLEGEDAVLDYPILRDLREEGATDYAALPVPFSDGQIHALTLATDRPGGFDTSQLGHVHEILPLVSRLVEVHATRSTARTLLEIYLGTNTGGRVLDGRVRRGDGELIPAVVWWADLRGSTALAEQLPREAYLELLNHFFEGTAGTVLEHGGEVLKFIGDAVLAIFPLGEDPRAAERALRAAREALARIEAFNAERSEGEARLAVALALHVGEVTYGNVGIDGRLDFTVTGPAVNTVARLERLSKRIGHRVVASGSMAALVPDAMASLGAHALAGLQEPVETFTLKELA